MPEIVFDPPDVNWKKYKSPKNNMKGGALTGDKRSEYVNLCMAITSRNPSLDYANLRDKILDIIKEDVIGYILTLPKPNQPSLLDDIETFYKGIDKTDNPFNCINIFGLQISILFTQYHEDKSDPGKYFIDPDGTGPQGDYENFIEINWKSYTDLKKMANRTIFSFLTKNPDPTQAIPESKPIFMIFIGFLRLGELMQTIFNNVFLCSTSYTIEYVDGIQMNPMTSLWHDGSFHYEIFRGCFEKPTIVKEIRDFLKYISTKDKPTQYAINFVLFFIYHEDVSCEREEMEENSLNTRFFNMVTKEDIYNEILRYIHGFSHLHDFASAIPKGYREIVDAEKGELNREKIKEYLDIVADIYVKTYEEYKKTRAIGGRRKTRKSSKTIKN
jgi:hypothetical protein